MLKGKPMKIKSILTAAALLTALLLAYTLVSCGPGEHDHVYELAHTENATCSENGANVYRCTVCGEESREITETLPHTYSRMIYDPTCAEEGYILYTCDICGHTEKEPIPALGHEYGETSVIVTPTEENTGIGKHVCSRCGHTEQFVMEKLPHTHVYNVAEVPGTCLEYPKTVYTCEKCGYSYEKVSPELGPHTYGMWVESVKPTLTSEGESKRVCELCGAEETRAVAKLSFEVPDETPVTGIENHIDTHVVMSFVGDCMLASERDRDTTNAFKYYAKEKDPAYFFEKVQDYFGTDDFTVVNLENVLTDKKLTEVPKSGSKVYWYRGPTSNADILTHGSVEGVTFANNHANDYGRQGYLDTIEAIENAGLNYGVNGKISYYTKDGFRVAVICCTLYGSYQTDDVIEYVEEASARSDYQVVYFHGGEMYSYAPESWMVKAVHAIVDAGADCVLGAHPHVLRPYEYYNGAHIVYSLGNFCYGGKNYPINATLIFQLDLEVVDGKLASVTPVFIPCYVYTGKMNNYQPAVMPEGKDKQQVLDFLEGKVKLPYIE